MARIHWNGNYANDKMSGSVVAASNGLLTIKWDDVRKQIIPEFVTKGHGWRVE